MPHSNRYNSRSHATPLPVRRPTHYYREHFQQYPKRPTLLELAVLLVFYAWVIAQLLSSVVYLFAH